MDANILVRWAAISAMRPCMRLNARVALRISSGPVSASCAGTLSRPKDSAALAKFVRGRVSDSAAQREKTNRLMATKPIGTTTNP